MESKRRRGRPRLETPQPVLKSVRLLPSSWRLRDRLAAHLKQRKGEVIETALRELADKHRISHD